MCYSATMEVELHSMVLAPCIITALSSGFNAVYFFGYRSRASRRRIAALTLAVLSVAIFMESLYSAVFTLFQQQQWASEFLLNPGCWLAVRLLLCLGSLLVSILILRQSMAKRR